MHTDPTIAVFWFHRMTKIDWSSSGGSDDFVVYYFAADTVQGYTPERFAPVKRQKDDGGPAAAVMAYAVSVNWLPGVAFKIISEVDRDYRRYRGIVDVDAY